MINNITGVYQQISFMFVFIDAQKSEEEVDKARQT